MIILNIFWSLHSRSKHFFPAFTSHSRALFEAWFMAPKNFTDYFLAVNSPAMVGGGDPWLIGAWCSPKFAFTTDTYNPGTVWNCPKETQTEWKLFPRCAAAMFNLLVQKHKKYKYHVCKLVRKFMQYFFFIFCFCCSFPIVAHNFVRFRQNGRVEWLIFNWGRRRSAGSKLEVNAKCIPFKGRVYF